MTETNEIFTTVSETENKIQDESLNKLLNEFANETAKDDLFKNKQPEQPEQPEQPKQPEQPEQKVKKSAAIWLLKGFDFIFSISASILTDLDRERFASTKSDLNELAEMLEEYEKESGKKLIGSPMAAFWFSFAFLYGEKVYDVYSVYKKQNEQKKPEQQPVYNFQREIHTPIQPEIQPEIQTDDSKGKKRSTGRGGARAGAGRPKGRKSILKK